MRGKSVHIKISPQLLARIDKAAKANMTTRSNYIRQAVTLRLNDEHIVPNPGQDDILELLKQV